MSRDALASWGFPRRRVRVLTHLAEQDRIIKLVLNPRDNSLSVSNQKQVLNDESSSPHSCKDTSQRDTATDPTFLRSGLKNNLP